MVDVALYLSVCLLNSRARSTLYLRLCSILVCYYRNTRLSLVILVCELVELCKVEIEIRTCCKSLSIEEASLLVCWVFACVIAFYHGVSHIYSIIMVVPYHLRFVACICSVAIVKAVFIPVIAVRVANNILCVSICEHQYRWISNIVMAFYLTKSFVVRFISAQTLEYGTHTSQTTFRHFFQYLAFLV